MVSHRMTKCTSTFIVYRVTFDSSDTRTLGNDRILQRHKDSVLRVDLADSAYVCVDCGLGSLWRGPLLLSSVSFWNGGHDVFLNIGVAW